MFQALTNLFSTKTTKPVRRNVGLSFDAMEARYAPAVLNPGVIRGFNPQPEPPVAHVSMTNVNEFVVLNPGVTRGIIITGG